VEFLRPGTLAEALEALAEHPDTLPIAGGTDVMVELNLGSRRPPALMDVGHLAELGGWARRGENVRIGAGVPYAAIVDELAGPLPGLAAASRTVGSPQIRNRGTVGGNLGTASPAGDAHPSLLAGGATVELASTVGTRKVGADEFFLGPGRSSRRPDELVVAVEVPAARGPQLFAKIGPRNAMVIAVCSFALELDPYRRRVGTGIGSAAPTPVRARDAEEFLAGALEEHGGWDGGRLPDSALARFGELVAAAASPIDDVRGSAAYRRHALAVLARRELSWALGPAGRRMAA
jgi:CO/xanthine dehydrogenase FAD-binding subunit